jgi:hypothetical protein
MAGIDLHQFINAKIMDCDDTGNPLRHSDIVIGAHYKVWLKPRNRTGK